MFDTFKIKINKNIPPTTIGLEAANTSKKKLFIHVSVIYESVLYIFERIT